MRFCPGFGFEEVFFFQSQATHTVRGLSSKWIAPTSLVVSGIFEAAGLVLHPVASPGRVFFLAMRFIVLLLLVTHAIRVSLAIAERALSRCKNTIAKDSRPRWPAPFREPYREISKIASAAPGSAPANIVKYFHGQRSAVAHEQPKAASPLVLSGKSDSRQHAELLPPNIHFLWHRFYFVTVSMIPLSQFVTSTCFQVLLMANIFLIALSASSLADRSSSVLFSGDAVAPDGRLGVTSATAMKRFTWPA